MYVYYKIGTRSFRLRPPTFLRCKGTSKIRIDEKKRDIFSLSPLLCVYFREKRETARRSCGFAIRRQKGSATLMRI